MALAFEEEKLRFVPKKDVFDDYIEKAKNGICKVCGIVPLDEKKDEDICKFCLKFKELGEKLPKAKYINFNLDNLLSIELDIKPNKAISLSFDSYPLKRVANYVPKFSEGEIKKSKYELLDDKNEAVSERGIKTFYHIAVDGLKEDGDKFYGRKYLAILKADIDNLGQIFINGFKKDKQDNPLFHPDYKGELKNEATFSRILYLSRMIDYFFTNILNEYIKGKNIYTVFAGGDDLFLIGHYEDIINTYEWIIEKLKDYTKNKDFHLSAAIKLTKPNVPINLMAEFTEEELEEAKKLDGKDALSIFDITLKNNEFKEMVKKREFFEKIYNELNQINSGSSFMYKFYDFIEMQKNLKKDILRNSRWKYMLRYLIEKNIEIKKNDKQRKLKEKIKNDLMKVSDLIEKYDEKLKIPLNLFFYSIRTYSKKEK
jgi:CRISPR-associated protein Csm1